jgi:hypothetical protein
MLQDTVRRFVWQELLPLESLVLQRDIQSTTEEDFLPPEVGVCRYAKASVKSIGGSLPGCC